MNTDSRVNNLKTEFIKLTNVRENIIVIFDNLDSKIAKLKDFYAEFIQHNKHSLYIFGLDSFRFQGKMLDMEHDDMKRLFAAINNRIYCEYYKLCKIIVEYIINNFNDVTDANSVKLLESVKSCNNYPIYKDLEPYKEYDFSIVQSIHENIIILFGSINRYIVNKENELNNYKIKNEFGFNIDNFVHTLYHNIIVMREKLALFMTYNEFFHTLHTKYLNRFFDRMRLMYNQITVDVKFDEAINKTQTAGPNYANINLTSFTSPAAAVAAVAESIELNVQENIVIDNTFDLKVNLIELQHNAESFPLVVSTPTIEPQAIPSTILTDTTNIEHPVEHVLTSIDSVVELVEQTPPIEESVEPTPTIEEPVEPTTVEESVEPTTDEESVESVEPVVEDPAVTL